jgi:MFS family permease
VAEQADTPTTTWLKDFSLTWISRFSVFLAHHVTRPLIPLYLITFGASSTVIGAVMAAFTITATVTRVPIGMSIDRIGRKPFLLYGLAFFTAGNLGYLWAPSIALMIPCRLLHGLGWSGCTTAVDQSAPERRGQSLAQFQLFYDLGIGMGSLTLGALLDWIDQSFSAMYLAAAFVALIGLWINWQERS